MRERDVRPSVRRHRVAPRALGLLLALLIAASVGWVSSASAATSVRTCKTATVAIRVGHRTIHRRQRVCESGAISLTTATIPSTGGTFTLHFAATNSTSCTLDASPAFWTGANPTRVNCRGSYSAHVSGSVNGGRWTFRFIARNRYGQHVTVTITLTQLPQQFPVVQQSTNWAGYVIEGTGLYAAQGTFNVPTLAPTVSTSASSEWVGIDGNSNSSLIQGGVTERYDPSSIPPLTIYPWWEILPSPETPIPMTVNAGDSITVTVEQISGTTWGIEVADNTTTQHYVTYQTYAGPETSAEWILEAPSLGNNTLPLGVFSPNVTFSGLGSNGHKVLVDEIFLVQNGATVASPSATSANGFTVAYGPNPPPAP